MSEPIKIAIVIEGGCLGAVLTAGVPVEYVLIDYDVGDALGVPIIQANGTTEQAEVSTGTAEVGGQFVLDAFALAGMPVWRVVLAARGIQITAPDVGRARCYALADVKEFLRTLNCEVLAADETPEDAQAPSELQIDLDQECLRDGDLYTFSAILTLNVAAPSADTAVPAMRKLLQIETELPAPADPDPAHEGPPPEATWVTNPSAGQEAKGETDR